MQHTNPSSCKLHWANGCMCTTWLLARFPTASAISRSRGTSKFVTPSARNRPRARSSARYLQHIKRYYGRETLAKLRHCKEVGKVFASKTQIFPSSTAFFRHSGVHEEACPRDSRKTCTERDAERRGKMFVHATSGKHPSSFMQADWDTCLRTCSQRSDEAHNGKKENCQVHALDRM
jgi:hypothetical protein